MDTNKSLVLLIILSTSLGTYCKSTSIIPRDISLKKYEKLNWQEQTEYFDGHDKKKTSRSIPDDVYKNAFYGSRSPVTIAAIRSLSPALTETYRKDLYKLMVSRQPIVRWEACKQIAAYPLQEDLKHLIQSRNDREWMVRECVYSTLRLYESEKKEKKYFYYILAALRDKNPNVLSEIYKTLFWYRDERTFPYIFKRSYHTRNSFEMLVIIRELGKYNNIKVRNRLRELARNHDDFLIREEANKILLSLY
ncbi:MAG: HEAT repeat domain-containing protein [Leptospirales bacterium]